MASASAFDDEPTPGKPEGRLADELIGLDPHDPEVQAFAAHLDKLEETRSSFTVEGSLRDVGRFADAGNRVGGLTRQLVVLVVVLILLGTLYGLWNLLGLIFRTFFG